MIVGYRKWTFRIERRELVETCPGVRYGCDCSCSCGVTYWGILHGGFVAWLWFEQNASLVATTGIRSGQRTSTTKLGKKDKHRMIDGMR